MTYRILTVCTGNICRSPMAEYALREALDHAGLGDRTEVASVGTTGWEMGAPIDPRAGALLRRHGIDAAGHRARQLEEDELRRADLVLALDHDHVGPLESVLGPEHAASTVRMVRDFAPTPVQDTGIRDPWYGDESDFETAWEQIDEALGGIVDHVSSQIAADGDATADADAVGDGERSGEGAAQRPVDPPVQR
ncbi:low molecular weight protein-tyrosine-phosphatase [Brachybacterium paraconglomeratum]|uniref:low molecular weight protein-tyrosine-phosphatase n=1 Tax=Brachybacterium paraconglomeratum TaxID=173362 RepID=UPI0031E5E464